MRQPAIFPLSVSSRPTVQHPPRAAHYNGILMNSLLILASAKQPGFKHVEKKTSQEYHWQECPISVQHISLPFFFHGVFWFFTTLKGRHSWTSISMVSKSTNSASHKSKVFLKNCALGPGEMAEWFKALTIPAKDLVLIPRTYMAAQPLISLVPGDLMPSSSLYGYYMHIVHSHS